MHTLLLHLCLLLNQGPYKFSIDGKIDGITTGKFAVLSTEGKELLSTPIKEGKFSLKGELKETGQYMIQVNQAKRYCFLDGKEMTLFCSYKNLDATSLKGSPANELYGQYYKMIAEKLGNKISGILSEYRAALHDGDTVLADQKIDGILQLEAQRYPITKEFVQANRDNVFAAYIADVVKDESYEKGKELYDILSEQVQQNYFGQLLKQHVDELKISAIGATSPDFKVRSATGELVSLSSLKGKVVILDFWASWCGPCIQEMKYLKKIYPGLEKEKIAFVSISLDDSSEKWKEAYEKEQIPWINLHEEKGWKDSEIRKLYGIHTIPFVVLLDEQGKIIAKNLRRGGLQAKLQELLNK
ncbi:redoxin domain-containing protein [Chitinophaga sp. SYP-B3965]|uniref:TlpA disulfide reductase family protein n=1 Tax=Chitinophaga sp. SYP-B3965 TaxID=2663120 RepID=UPI001299C4C6|nr:TlpA disulfide reductase family protein [Chitinophaga sp. SYP-B3965]MRG48382.1 redoxin domain-containing protein [Chitinophaga sp. SYP-B3965]